MVDRAFLSSLIQSQHLAQDAVGSYRRAFESHPARFVVIKDFLVPEVAARLAEFLSREAHFEPEYGLYSVEDHKVNDVEWNAAEEQDRFFRYGKLQGVPPEFQFSNNSLTYLKFRNTFQTDDNLRTFFEDVTGIELAPSDDFGSHSMGVGDFLKPHDDNNRNRRLALVLYLSQGWRPEYGGTLHILDEDENESVVDARYNSLVAFDTLAGTTHYVAPIRPAAGRERRVTIGGWYHSPE